MNITFHFFGVFEFNGARWGLYGDYSGMKDPVAYPKIIQEVKSGKPGAHYDLPTPKSYRMFATKA